MLSPISFIPLISTMYILPIMKRVILTALNALHNSPLYLWKKAKNTCLSGYQKAAAN